MTSSGGRLSIGPKYILVIGFTLVVGVSLGALAVVVFQSLVNPNERTAHGGRQLYPTSRDIDSSERIDELVQFREIFNNRSIADQYIALYASLSLATEQELKEWWTQSKKIERNSHRETAQSAILRELAKINPHEALRYIDDVSIFLSDRLLIAVFSEWAVAHLDDAIEAIATLSGRRRETALIAVLEVRDDLSDSDLRSIAVRLGKEELYLKLFSDDQAFESLVKPEEAWDVLLNDDVDDFLQEESLAIVAEAWQEQDGFQVLSNIYNSNIESYQMKNRLLREIAKVDLPGAFHFSQGLIDESEKLHLARVVVREWVNDDALAALAAISTFEPSSMASQLEDYFSMTWARANPSEAIENIGTLSEEFRLFTLELAFSEIASKNPLDAIAKVSAVENFVGNTSSIVESIVSEWARKKPGDATDWVIQNYAREDPQRLMLLREVLSYLTREDPARAFELALQHPDPDSISGLEYEVISELSQLGDIELAVKFLPRVHENSKRRSYGAVGAALVRELRTDDALELGEDLDETNQTSYYYRVMLEWSRANPKNLFETLENLPSDALKSIAADQLIRRNRTQPVLTVDQIEHARTFVSSDD